MKAKFLVPVGVLATAMAAEHASAAIAPPDAGAESLQSVNTAAANVVPAQEPQDLAVRADGSTYSFVLKRTESGQLMAYHSSHSSHSSHYSHRSSSS
ncbi:MAG: His-Xaa-Ser repeat protein HxsA2 [Burkholderiales bacterium]|nr:His-Xaa-Ser repeat protein HxsA2 [Burkholderiales bacterium]